MGTQWYSLFRIRNNGSVKLHIKDRYRKRASFRFVFDVDSYTVVAGWRKLYQHIIGVDMEVTNHVIAL